MNDSFFATKLGWASIASVAAMGALVALSTQVTVGIDANLANVLFQPGSFVELA